MGAVSGEAGLRNALREGAGDAAVIILTGVETTGLISLSLGLRCLRLGAGDADAVLMRVGRKVSAVRADRCLIAPDVEEEPHVPWAEPGETALPRDWSPRLRDAYAAAACMYLKGLHRGVIVSTHPKLQASFKYQMYVNPTKVIGKVNPLKQFACCDTTNLM
jgi:hypothetical protein